MPAKHPPRNNGFRILGLAALLLLGVRLVAAPAEQAATNLIPNGNFKAVTDNGMMPQKWTTKHPPQVRWINDAQQGPAVEMDCPENLAATYGVDLLSDPIPFQPNHRYRVTGVTRSDGPKLILFVKGYATVTRTVKGKSETTDDVVFQMKKEIEPTRNWTEFKLDLEIKPVKSFSRFQHEIKYLRVLLWSYWPKGVACWANLRMEDAGEIPAAEQLHPKAVTHVGTPPRLLPDGEAPATQPAATRPAAPVPPPATSIHAD